jgi:hypothetical protein
MKHIQKAALWPLLMFLSACGGGGTTSNTGSNPSNSVNMAGNWQFMGNSTAFGYTYTASGPINQTGSSISGTLSLSGSPCAQATTFSGTLNGTSLSATATENTQTVSYSGTVSADGSSASGTYSAPPGGCLNGDIGTWSGSRVSLLNGQFIGSMAAENSIRASIVAKLQDDGGRVSGMATVTNSVCFHSLNLTGSVSGNEVVLQGTEETQTLLLRGEIDRESKSLALIYSVSGGNCSGESGKAFLAARQ